MKKIAVIGAGQIGLGLTRQFLRQKLLKPSGITVTRKNKKGLKQICSELKIDFTDDNRKAVLGKQVVILAIKPQDMKKVAQELKPVIKKDQIIVSVAAGLGISFYEKYFPQNPIFRVMPNPFLSSGLGVMAYSRNKKTGASDIRVIRSLFTGLSEDFFEIKDGQMHAFTAFATSGAAVFYYFLNALMDSAKKNKFNAKEAKKLILLTARAATAHSIKSDEDLKRLIEHVCTPKGVTIQGIDYLKKHKIDQHIKTALKEIIKKSEKIAKN